MPLGDHLRELRRRLFRSALSLIVGAVIGWFASNVVMGALRAPITEIATSQKRLAALNYSTITGAFDLRIEVAITVGVIVSSPVWLCQLWAFLVPALSRRERRYAFGFFFSAVPLFSAGVITGWLLLPHIVLLLSGFAASSDGAIIDAKTYFDFVLKLTVAVGVGFVLPLFLVLLNFVGVLSAKSILASWRTALIAIAAFAAVATPAADVLSMLLLTVPLVSLYFASAGIAALHDKRARQAVMSVMDGAR